MATEASLGMSTDFSDCAKLECGQEGGSLPCREPKQEDFPHVRLKLGRDTRRGRTCSSLIVVGKDSNIPRRRSKRNLTEGSLKVLHHGMARKLDLQQADGSRCLLP